MQEGDDYEVIPGSEFTVARTANRSALYSIWQWQQAQQQRLQQQQLRSILSSANAVQPGSDSTLSQPRVCAASRSVWVSCTGSRLLQHAPV